jgi:hypothetical protein
MKMKKLVDRMSDENTSELILEWKRKCTECEEGVNVQVNATSCLEAVAEVWMGKDK